MRELTDQERICVLALQTGTCIEGFYCDHCFLDPVLQCFGSNCDAPMKKYLAYNILAHTFSKEELLEILL